MFSSGFLISSKKRRIHGGALCDRADEMKPIGYTA
jgi:hypothetical protein